MLQTVSLTIKYNRNINIETTAIKNKNRYKMSYERIIHVQLFI